MRIEGLFKLSHRNSRIERMGSDEQRLALDLKFERDMPLEMLEGLLGPAFVKATANGYYDKKGNTDHSGLVLKPPLKGVEIAVRFHEDGISTKQEVSGKDSKLDKITLTLKPLKLVELSFRIIFYPSPEQDGLIGSMLNKDVLLMAEGRQGELDLDRKKEKDEEPEEETA